MARVARGAACVAAMLLATGCETATPPQPLYQALQPGGGFGYTEMAQSGNFYQVAYVGPQVPTSLDPQLRQVDIDAAKGQAYDLALLRAAKLTLQMGHTEFAVVHEQRDVEVHLQKSYGSGLSYPVYSSYGYPAPLINPFPSPIYSNASLIARATLNIEFDPTSGNILEATETAAVLEAKYGKKTYPPS